jgi:hypothetical protein
MEPLAVLASLSSELSEKTPVISPHSLLNESRLIVEPEDVQQAPDYAFAVRRKRSSR